MSNHRKLLAAAGLAAVIVLSGCWHDDDDDVAATEVPDSASVSTAAFVSYLLSLNASDESSEPLIIRDTFVVPPDDTSEPTPLT